MKQIEYQIKVDDKVLQTFTGTDHGTVYEALMDWATENHTGHGEVFCDGEFVEDL